MNFYQENFVLKILDNKKRNLLIEQVNELRKIDYNIDFVYMKNSELELEDSKL